MASRVLGAFAVTATAALASLALATPAFAHTDEVTAVCDEKSQKSILTVGLTNYAREERNTLTITVDGTEKFKKAFGRTFEKQTWELPADVDHTYKVSIYAYDDPNKTRGWTKDYDLTTVPCVKTPPKPEEPTPPVPTTTTTTTTTTEAPSSSVTPPPAPGGSTPEPPLAATGASPTWLLLSGLGLVGAGAGTLLFLRRRRSA